MMELLGCPCTYFAPMWDDDPLLECLQMNLEPEGGSTWRHAGAGGGAVLTGAAWSGTLRRHPRRAGVPITPPDGPGGVDSPDAGAIGLLPDIVDQGVEQIGILADGLAKSELWYFWWN